MAPTESSILGNFLLSPAPLPTIMSLQQFTELFPKRLRSHPHIRALYRELQELRENDMDLVNGNIDKEVRQGETQKAELRKSVTKTGVDGLSSSDQREMDMDVQLFGQTSSSDYHSPSSLLDAMEKAISDIDRQVSETDEEATAILTMLNNTVGEMSDLRYGKMQGPAGTSGEDMVNEAIRGLGHLEDANSKMPSIPLHPRASNPSARVNNPLPQLLQTPSGLALLELQGTINIPSQENSENNESSGSSPAGPGNPNGAPVFETPIGKLMFPDYSPQFTAPDDTKWMKRVYLYVGRYQRMTGEVKKLPQPLAIVQRRQKELGAAADDKEELEIVEIVKYKIYFKSRPEPVNDI
ncbi:hypothetical protein ASPFODRAFT_59978 [Aspergillus luchuensis CBS 106.47]|uniref:Ctf8-domain-containing protein n=2 Tax=Aspergillus kawachii TaxID=1069201 RepID=A0A1M3TLP7_ASPLC|nr:hypothetical protein ASPFODRAFT_59978 [Aspergillus luchuensis CBS 106.47]